MQAVGGHGVALWVPYVVSVTLVAALAPRLESEGGVVEERESDRARLVRPPLEPTQRLDRSFHGVDGGSDLAHPTRRWPVLLRRSEAASEREERLSRVGSSGIVHVCNT